MQALALRIGNILNQADVARDCGVSPATTNRYIRLLEASHLVTRLNAFSVNRTKRLIKAPRLFLCDAGLACFLAGLHSPAQLATSDMMFLADRVYTPGYEWVDFAFNGQDIILQPGRYWAALGFTGGPIVNWFFSYGKPTGPQDGTRFRTLFDEQWSHSHAFEFNYRVTGFVPENF